MISGNFISPQLIVSVLFPIFIGMLLLYPIKKICLDSLWLRSSVAVGMGLGVTSLIYSLYLLAFGPSSSTFSFEVSLLILFVIFMMGYHLVEKRKRERLNNDNSTIRHKALIDKCLIVIFSVVFFISCITYIVMALDNPHGGWDAWAIWNLKARFIFRGGENWRDVFTIIWSHPDYPLLIPLSVSRIWKNIGNDTIMIPIIISFLFTFATVILLFSALSNFRNRTQGCLAAIILMTTPFFIEHGTAQYADVPLAYFFILTFVMITLYDLSPSADKSKILFFAGLSAGLAAWTKNEGMLFIMAILLARSMLVMYRQGLRHLMNQTAFFLSGLLPAMAVIGYFKIGIIPASNDLLGSLDLTLFKKIIDFSRHYTIAATFYDTSMTFASGVMRIPHLLIGYAILLGIRKNNPYSLSSMTIIFAIVIMLIGYYFIYVITPYNINWHLGSSLNRLFLQLWPSFIFYLFLILYTPEEKLNRIQS